MDADMQFQEETPSSEKAKQLDPKNPFENTLEPTDYRTDYRRVLPQILLPGFRVPLFPEREERREIRKRMNAAGAAVLCNSVLTQVLFLSLMLIILLLMDGNLSSYFSADGGGAFQAFQDSSSMMALHGLVFGGLNLCTALIGCRYIRVPARDLFQTHDFSAKHGMQYCLIGIGLQFLAGMAYQLLYWVFEQNGMTLAEPTVSSYADGKAILTTVLYTCLLAPVTEELLYRGFVLKALSTVSVRFGIIASALLFGMMHGNFGQFLLAVLAGLFLAKIDVRHNSLLPSMLVHIAINTCSVLLDLADTFLTNGTGEILQEVFSFLYLLISIWGLILWLMKERKQPIPCATQKQAVRNRVFWSSPCLLCAFAILIAEMLYLGFA